MSSSLPAVDVRGLSKEYRLKHNMSRPTTIVEAINTRWRRIRRGATEPFWALRDVSFTVERGEMIGIIGSNGAGKSTLLKILSRVVEPTNGEAFLRGRLGSLLEVGTGFHPDLTGRENVFLNGSMLGMSRATVQRQFDNIAEFSGVERFLDTPVKRYSSGMYVRLAFAVAAHLDCDVLIVDEVLAVGDEAFQRKCLGKMDEVAGQGRTVLFVSHNMAAVASLTKRSIVIEQGRMVFDGPTAKAVDRYLGQSGADVRGYVAPPRADRPAVTRVDITTSHDGRVHTHGRPLLVSILVATPEPMVGARVVITVTNRVGRALTESWIVDSATPMCRTAGTHRLLCRFPCLRLAPGEYMLRVVFADQLHGRHDSLERVCPFDVVMSGEVTVDGWRGLEVAYVEDAEWTAEAIATDS